MRQKSMDFRNRDFRNLNRPIIQKKLEFAGFFWIFLFCRPHIKKYIWNLKNGNNFD